MAKKKKKQKKNQFKKIIFALFFIFVLAVVGYFGFKSYNEINSIIKDVESFEYTIPENIEDKIDLPTKIGDRITIEWKSSNPDIVSTLGVITKPDFESDINQVTLTGKNKVEFKELLTETIINLLGIKIEDLVYVIEVEPEEATDELKVKAVIERLSLIEETYESIALPEKLLFNSINIKWDSLNDSVMSDEGDVIKPLEDTVVTLKAIVSSNDYQEIAEYQITVHKEDQSLYQIKDWLEDQAPTSTYKTLTSNAGVIYNNARVMQKEGYEVDESDLNATVPTFVRLRNKDENNGSFEINNIYKANLFLFGYCFAGSQKSVGSKLVVTIIADGQEIKEEFDVLHGEELRFYSKELSQYTNVSIKVEHIDEWSTDTYLDIFMVSVYAKPSEKDLQEWVISNTPTKLSKSTILPFTTPYGGKITWTSNSSAITKDGIVTRGEQSQTVTLTANINYSGEETTVTIEVIVTGKKTVQALEIFFIDIGKYGAGDCGECTYIKYGDIDIIVDAGDHFDATVQAITETINQKLNDEIIEYVIATHPDGDHIGGMAKLFEAYNIENLIKFEGDYHTQKYENLKNAYTSEGCNVYEIKTDIIDKNLGNKFIELTNDVFISFIDTTYYDAEESNGKSIVFTLEAYGTRVLMTGDADNATGHTDLEQKYKNQVGDIDILKVVHHGTSNGTTIDYLNVVDPEVAIICNGNYLGNKHGHPTPTALSNLYTYDSNMKVYAITGGGTIDGVVNKTNNTYKCSSEDRFNQRNGLITLIIDNNGYYFSSEYYGNNIFEIKNTDYYKAIVANGLK